MVILRRVEKVFYSFFFRNLLFFLKYLFFIVVNLLGEIPMSFYSGKNKDDAPRVCVNGRM